MQVVQDAIARNASRWSGKYPIFDSEDGIWYCVERPSDKNGMRASPAVVNNVFNYSGARPHYAGNETLPDGAFLMQLRVRSSRETDTTFLLSNPSDVSKFLEMAGAKTYNQLKGMTLKLYSIGGKDFTDGGRLAGIGF